MPRRRARLGDNLVQCDRTGFTRYASKTSKEWNGLRVWDREVERRNPQGLVRSVREDQTGPHARTVSTRTFTGPWVTELNATKAAGDTSLTVVSSARMVSGDNLQIILDNNDMYAVTLSSVDDGTTITIGTALPGSTSAVNAVTYISVITAPDLG